MRVLFRALLLAGAVVAVWHLRPGGASSAKRSPSSDGGEHAQSARAIDSAARASTPSIVVGDVRPPVYRGVVIDGKSGEPVGDAQVMLCRAIKDGHPACADSVAAADTGDDGRFEIERPDEEVGALVVDVDGFATAVVQGPGADSRVELWPPAVVRGRVVDFQGEPLHGVRVGWLLPNAQLRLDPDDSTQANGAFELSGLPAGQVTVYAITDDHRTVTAKLSLARGEKRELELVVEEAEPLHVRGVVIDRVGRPLAFTAVTIEARADLAAPDADALLAADQQRHLSTDLDGEFEVDFHTPGPHRLSFWAWDRDTGDLLAQAMVTAAADPAPIKIPVWDPNVVVCRLRDESGQPEPFTEYWYSYSLAGEEDGDGVMGAGLVTSGGSKGYAEMAFVWPRRINSIEISLQGESAEGSVTLRGPTDPCVARGDR